MDENSFNIRVPKKWVRVAMIVGVTALIVAPLTAIASHSFTDVPDSNTFHEDIAWLADANVTRGCNPPDNTQFCPDDNVTRGQMSAFMRRFSQYIGAEDGTPAQADNATTADDAGTLDGKSSSVFVEEGEANTVTDEMVVDEPGIASTHVDELTDLTGSAASYASVTISAPTDGYVVLNASTYFTSDHTSGGGNDIPRASISSSPTSMNFNAFQLGRVVSDQPSGIYRTTISLVAVEPVTQGDHTFHLVADVFSESAADANDMHRRTLTATFVPTAYGSVVENAASGIAGSSESDVGK